MLFFTSISIHKKRRQSAVSSMIAFFCRFLTVSRDVTVVPFGIGLSLLYQQHQLFQPHQYLLPLQTQHQNCFVAVDSEKKMHQTCSFGYGCSSHFTSCGSPFIPDEDCEVYEGNISFPHQILCDQQHRIMHHKNV